MLSLMIFIPILTSVFLYILPLPLRIVKIIALSSSTIVALISLQLYAQFVSTNELQFIEHYDWIKSYGITYHIGVDGVSLGLVMMVSLLMPLIGLGMINRDKKGLWLNLLLAEGGIMGAALSLDLMLFYLFWETMLLPIFFLIGLYGYGRHTFTSMKFTLYTIFGSLIMLLGILFLAISYKNQFGFYSFALNDLSKVVLSDQASLLTFLAFMLAFAIKVPLFPFHTWLSDTYRSAPTGAVIVMSALMAKLGVYAIWRFLFTLFHETSHELSIYFIILGLFGLIYFGILAMHQSHLKRLFAFSSASHLSLIVVGIFIYDVYGLMGSAYFIVAHALSSAGLFLMVGMLYERTKTHSLEALGGIAKQAPLFGFLFAFFALSTVGIPGTSGFVSEVLIILGAFNYNIYVGFVATTSILVAILFIFTMLQKTIYSATQSATENFYDLSKTELMALIPIALLILVMGVFPNYFLEKIEPTAMDSINTTHLLQGVK